MKKLAKKAIALLVTGVIAMGLVTGCGINNDAVVAKVGEAEISLGVANFYARQTQAYYESMYNMYYGGIDWTAETEGVSMEASVKDEIMHQIQELYVLDLHAKDFNVSLSAEEMEAINKAADQFIKDNSSKTLKKVSGEKDVVVEFLRLQAISTKMREAMIADVDREVADDEAAQKLMGYASFSYTIQNEDGTTTTLTDDEKTALKEKAKEFLKKAKKAKDAAALETLAEEYGVTWNKDVAFDATATSPSEDVVKAVDGLKKAGKFAKIVETEDGLYVAQLISKFDREATDTKKEEIIAERENEDYQNELEEWENAVTITVDEKAWAKVKFDKLGVEMLIEEQE